jgi:hypothetical protein
MGTSKHAQTQQIAMKQQALSQGSQQVGRGARGEQVGNAQRGARAQCTQRNVILTEPLVRARCASSNQSPSYRITPTPWMLP